MEESRSLRWPVLLAAIVVVVAVVGIGACSNGSGNDASSDSASQSPTTATVPPTAPPPTTPAKKRKQKPRKPAVKTVIVNMRKLRGAGRARAKVALSSPHGSRLQLGVQAYVPQSAFGVLLFSSPTKKLLLASAHPGRVGAQTRFRADKLVSYRWIEVVKVVRGQGQQAGNVPTVTILRFSTARLLHRLVNK